MISEVTIINLQVIASVLMGYEFFISGKMKTAIDLWAKGRVLFVRDSSLKEVSHQLSVLKKNIPYYVSATVCLVLGIICSKMVIFFETQLNLIWLAIIMALATIFFIVGAFNAVLEKLIIEGLAPMIVPLGQWVVALYLLFTAKGVISGVGFVFLAASFIVRYYNASYS